MKSEYVIQGGIIKKNKKWTRGNNMCIDTKYKSTNFFNVSKTEGYCEMSAISKKQWDWSSLNADTEGSFMLIDIFKIYSSQCL